MSCLSKLFLKRISRISLSFAKAPQQWIVFPNMSWKNHRHLALCQQLSFPCIVRSVYNRWTSVQTVLHLEAEDCGISFSWNYVANVLQCTEYPACDTLFLSNAMLYTIVPQRPYTLYESQQPNSTFGRATMLWMWLLEFRSNGPRLRTTGTTPLNARQSRWALLW